LNYYFHIFGLASLVGAVSLMVLVMSGLMLFPNHQVICYEYNVVVNIIEFIFSIVAVVYLGYILNMFRRGEIRYE
jgi:hypothetical protein